MTYLYREKMYLKRGCKGENPEGKDPTNFTLSPEEVMTLLSKVVVTIRIWLRFGHKN